MQKNVPSLPLTAAQGPLNETSETMTTIMAYEGRQETMIDRYSRGLLLGNSSINNTNNLSTSSSILLLNEAQLR